MIMKKIITFILIFAVSIAFAQNEKPIFEKVGDLVKATYFYDNGTIKEQGFFKDKKLTGQWTQFNIEGKKTMIATFNEGKKTGKWFAINDKTIKEINYNNNVIVSIKEINSTTELVYNKE